MREQCEKQALANDNQNYNYQIYQLLKAGKNDISITGDSDLIHELASDMRDLKKLMLDSLIMQDGRQRVMSFAEMHKKFEGDESETIKMHKGLQRESSESSPARFNISVSSLRKQPTSADAEFGRRIRR